VTEQVSSVNGVKVRNLPHLIKLLEEKKDGYAIIRFDREIRPLILDLKQFRADRSRAYRKNKTARQN